MQDFIKRQALTQAQDVIWRDMDAFEHINNAVYFRYFEDIRIAFFDEIGVMAYKDGHGIGPILASTQCQFLAPLSYPDHIHIGVRIDEPEGKRLPMHYEVYSEKLARVVARGEGLVIFYDYNSNCSTAIPDELKHGMNKLRAKQENSNAD